MHYLFISLKGNSGTNHYYVYVDYGFVGVLIQANTLNLIKVFFTALRVKPIHLERNFILIPNQMNTLFDG